MKKVCLILIFIRMPCRIPKKTIDILQNCNYIELLNSNLRLFYEQLIIIL
jgi:hypothetical protein